MNELSCNSDDGLVKSSDESDSSDNEIVVLTRVN
jgi:hypothetical protein